MNSTPLPERRLVAIVGRPNVGKSALFNRLTKRRLSIVHEESGVTRDRVMAEASWAGSRFDLVDTGGLGLFDGARGADVFEEGIRSQVAIAIQDAAALIFVVTADTGVVPLDREVARLLHESGRPVLVAVNKSDNSEMDRAAEEFESLGFPVFPVSALHNRGLDPLLERVLPELPQIEEPSRADPLKVAIVGKPNAGKSSYINRLLRSDRVMVSEIPGTTRDSVEIPFSVGAGPDARHYLLIDTAGLRQKKKVREAVDKFSMIRTEKSIEMADVVVHVLDAMTGFGANDKKIASLIAGMQKGCLLLVNKWDLSQVTQRAYQKRLLEEAPFLRHVPVEFASAASGYNIRRTVDAIDKVAAQIRMKLSTGVLNRVLHDAFAKVQPPVVNGKRVRFFYATQTGTQPIRVRLFVSNPKYLDATYRQYILNGLRRAFGLEGAPVVLQFVPRRQDPERAARVPRGGPGRTGARGAGEGRSSGLAWQVARRSETEGEEEAPGTRPRRARPARAPRKSPIRTGRSLRRR